MPPRPGPGWAPSELPEGQDKDEKTRAARCSSVTRGHGVCGFESLDENKDKKEKKTTSENTGLAENSFCCLRCHRVLFSKKYSSS